LISSAHNTVKLSLHQIARLLPNGKIDGDHVRGAGPGHSSRDNSLCVWLHDDGTIGIKSWANDDVQTCLDYVHDHLGIERRRYSPRSRSVTTRKPKPKRKPDPNKIERAYQIWEAARPIVGTIAETYLRGRGLV
jgi:putative DNA primase/helicase